MQANKYVAIIQPQMWYITKTEKYSVYQCMYLSLYSAALRL